MCVCNFERKRACVVFTICYDFFTDLQAAYPARSIFLLWGLREFPRLTIVYMFLCYNQDVFQPLLYYTSETEEVNGRLSEVGHNLLKKDNLKVVG